MADEGKPWSGNSWFEALNEANAIVGDMMAGVERTTAAMESAAADLTAVIGASFQQLTAREAEGEKRIERFVQKIIDGAGNAAASKSPAFRQARRQTLWLTAYLAGMVGFLCGATAVWFLMK